MGSMLASFTTTGWVFCHVQGSVYIPSAGNFCSECLTRTFSRIPCPISLDYYRTMCHGLDHWQGLTILAIWAQCGLVLLTPLELSTLSIYTDLFFGCRVSVSLCWSHSSFYNFFLFYNLKHIITIIAQNYLTILLFEIIHVIAVFSACHTVLK